MQSPEKTDTAPSPEKNNTEAEPHDTLASSAFQRLEPLLITSATMPLPQDPDVTCGSLACGLRYYIKKNHKPEQRVALRLAVRVGSLQEEEAERGIAHMVEHLAFRATTNYDKLELVEYLESIGAAFGACQNAYTSFDETVYMLSVPSDGKDLVKQSIQVLHEWACRIRISDEDVEAERGIVLEEWRAGRSARCAPRQPASTPGPATHTRLPPWPDRACAWRLPQPLLAEWRRTTGSSSCRAARVCGPSQRRNKSTPHHRAQSRLSACAIPRSATLCWRLGLFRETQPSVVRGQYGVTRRTSSRPSFSAWRSRTRFKSRRKQTAGCDTGQSQLIHRSAG